jgi:hypothetical protein
MKEPITHWFAITSQLSRNHRQFIRNRSQLIAMTRNSFAIDHNDQQFKHRDSQLCRNDAQFLKFIIKMGRERSGSFIIFGRLTIVFLNSSQFFQNLITTVRNNTQLEYSGLF